MTSVSAILPSFERRGYLLRLAAPCRGRLRFTFGEALA